jgi:predicted permease
LALFGGVGLILLIACANVANLWLARTNHRQKEMTLRMALGAPKHRIVRQLLTENVLLAILGGMAAIAIGAVALKALLGLRPAELARLGPVELNAMVLVFTSALSLLTGMVFGLGPAVGAAKLNLAEAIREAGRSAAGGKHRTRSLLVVSEAALGFVLLIGAGLMLRTFVGILGVNPGFDPANVLTFQFSLPEVRYPTAEKQVTFFRQLQKNLLALPGVQAVGAVSHVPLAQDGGNCYSYYWPEGATKHDQNTVMADERGILPGYFRSIGATLIAGRDFDEFDDASHRHVIVVDDTLARQTWPNAAPLGKKLSVENIRKGNFQFERDWAEVVGVVRHI